MRIRFHHSVMLIMPKVRNGALNNACLDCPLSVCSCFLIKKASDTNVNPRNAITFVIKHLWKVRPARVLLFPTKCGFGARALQGSWSVPTI